ncbi:hypothetical protein BV20DRAFT_962352 [Pilatotrama ljubarskyi]|nr:hypothetical protein BV20DRAFT_962352 [Pilatotrama ljubarskyi]
MSSDQSHVPRKRFRDPDSPSDTDAPSSAQHLVGVQHTAYLETPPPSSPARAPAGASEQPSMAATRPRASFAYEQPTLREACLMSIKKNYPGFDPVNLNDFQLLTLSGAGYKGAMDDVASWLQQQFDEVVQLAGGDANEVLNSATDSCNQRVAVIGMKPCPGASNASIRPVGGTQYSMRLWPASDRQWCFDFVNSITHEPKNKPFEFELWSVPLEDPAMNRAPWLPLDLVSRRLQSLEHGFGLKEEDIGEGEEKFVFMDGQTCVLKRPGHRDIRFTVPNRCPATIEDEAEVVSFA